MKTYNYKKIVHLPSNGIDYDPVCMISPLTNSIFYALEDFNITRNETEFIASVLENHVHSKNLNILNMYYYDLFFIWQLLFNNAFLIDSIDKTSRCKKCDHETKIKIPNSQLDIKYLTKKESKNIYCSFSINEKEIIFVFDRRRVKHNIESSNANIKYSFILSGKQQLTEKEQTDYFLNLIIPQILDIKIDGESIDKDYKEIIMDMCSYYGNNINSLVYELYFQFIDKVDFGVMNSLYYTCKNCGTKNQIKLIDNVSASIYSVNNSGTLNSELSNYFSFVHTKLITFSEIMDIPVYLNKIVLKQISKTLESSSPKQHITPEEMGIGII